MEAKFAADKLDAKVMIFADSLRPEEKKAEEKKDEKKDEKAVEKKDDKKEPGKDDKKDEKTLEATEELEADKQADKKDEKKAEVKEEQKADKKDDKQAEKKEDKQADKKDEKKEAAEKKDEKQEVQTPPQYKEGVKPLVTLYFAKVDKDKMLVKRELPAEESKDSKDKKADASPTVTYFTVSTAAYEKIVPRDMALAFFDTTLKTFDLSDAVKLELARGARQGSRQVDGNVCA